MKIRNIIISMALLTAPIFVFGQSRAVPMLEINPDARATAMGGNQYGEAQTMMIYSNPTSILYNEDVWNFSASTQIYPSADEVGRLMFYGASASRRFGIHGVHIGFRYLGGYSIPMDGGKNLKPADWSVDVAYSLRLFDHFSASVGASFIRSKVFKEASTVAFNVAAYYRNSFNMGIDADYIIGINAANMGPDLDYGKKYKKAKLPANFGGGGELGLNFSEKNKLNVSLAGQYYYLPEKAKLFTGNVGAEYTYAKMISLRAGYSYAQHDYSHFAFGAGFSYRIFHLGVTHQRGLGGNDVNVTLISLGASF